MAKNDDKPSKQELFMAIGFAMERHPILQTLPNFTYRYAAFRTETSLKKLPIRIDENGECTQLNEDALVEAILQYTTSPEMVIRPDYGFTERVARECARFWLFCTYAMEEPKPFLWEGEEGLTFRRLPFELDPNGKALTWDILCSRMSNVDAFKEWVGSLFVPESGRQQYLWIYGEGNDGKGSLNRIFSRIFGSTYYAGHPPRAERQEFWGYFALIGKRLVVFPDCNAAGFVKGGYFKSLTGDDPLAVEIKGGEAFTYKPHAKFMFHSNVKPNISSQTADLRRVILCSFDPKGVRAPGTPTEFEDRLWQEAGIFIAQCIKQYREEYPDNGPIKNGPDGKAAIDELVSSNEEDFELAVEEAFDIVPDGHTSRAILRDQIKSRFFDRTRRDEFMRWLVTRHGVHLVQLTVNGKNVKKYRGIAIKPGGLAVVR